MKHIEYRVQCVIRYVLCSNSNRALKFFVWMPSNHTLDVFDNTCCLSIARWWFKLQVLIFIRKTKKLCFMFHKRRSSNRVPEYDGWWIRRKNSKKFTWTTYASYQWWHTLLHFISRSHNILRRQAWPRLLLTDPYSLRLMAYGLNQVINAVSSKSR